MTASADITVDFHDGVLTATLTRAHKKNALTDDMYRQLADAVERAQEDSAVRALVIRSEGDLFCAGNDLGDFAGADRTEDADGGEQEERNVTRFLRTLVECDTPVIAAVQGKAVGVGTTMLLHCDVVLVTEDAQLITPFVNLALVPEAASSALLVQRIGHVRLFNMFVLGEPLGAQAAVDGGVANAIVPAADLHAEAERYAWRIVQLAGGIRHCDEAAHAPARGAACADGGGVRDLRCAAGQRGGAGGVRRVRAEAEAGLHAVRVRSSRLPVDSDGMFVPSMLLGMEMSELCSQRMNSELGAE